MNLKKLSVLGLSLACICTTQVAHAQLAGVKSATITNAQNTWLQVAEFVATQTATGNDVALSSAGATAYSPNGTWNSTSTAGKAIDGSTNGAFNFGGDTSWGIFHPSETHPAYLQITFASEVALNSITIYGRTDCCSDRDTYNVTLFGTSGNTLWSGYLNATGATHSATHSFVASVPEPEAYAMFLAGLGLMGAIARRRRAAQV